MAQIGDLEVQTMCFFLSTLGFQLEDMFQFKGTPQGIDHVMFQLKDVLWL